MTPNLLNSLSMKRVVVLGSTGSIGTQTLDVIRQHPDLLRVVGLAAGSNESALREQARVHGVKDLALFEGNPQGDIPVGMEALLRLVRMAQADLVVIAVAGVIGLLPTMAAIEAGKSIALASKEVLVAAGELVMPAIKQAGVSLTPIDSEHSAIFQCIQGSRPDQIDSVVLTASGGPFRGKKRADLAHITVEQALNHPTWRMGGKITIDSATLMNKALETIEASWLFELPVSKVETVVHPQSIVHSFVRLTDGSVLGQLGWPDMRLPIAYSLLYPERPPSDLRRWNPIETPNLTFEPVDEGTFPALSLAREAARIGGTMPCALNAANEEAANAFLRGELGFLRIPEVVEQTMATHQSKPVTLDNLLAADAEARDLARSQARNPIFQ